MTQRWVLSPLVVVCLLAYGQVVSGVGLLIWVIPAALIAVGVVGLARLTLPERTAQVAVWPALALSTVVWAGVVELLSGQTSGPVARSSLIVGGLTGAMGALLLTRWKASCLVPAVAMFAGALALGASGRLPLLTGAFAVAAAWALFRLGPFSVGEVRDRHRAVPIAIVALIAGAAALAGTVASASVMGEPWSMPGVVADEAVTTPVDPLASSSPSPSPTPVASESPTPVVVPEDPFESAGADALSALTDTVLPALRNVAVALVVLVVAWLVVMLAWRAWVTMTWRALRRRLAAGHPRDRVLGAWAWARLRLGQAGHHLAPAASPDVVAAGDGLDAVPSGLERDLTKLARISAAAGFAPDLAEPASARQEREASLAWALARDVESCLRRQRRLREWWGIPARRPDLDLLAIHETAADPHGVSTPEALPG